MGSSEVRKEARDCYAVRSAGIVDMAACGTRRPRSAQIMPSRRPEPDLNRYPILAQLTSLGGGVFGGSKGEMVVARGSSGRMRGDEG